MQGDLQEYLGQPKAATRRLTLDQVMACDIPDFQTHYNQILVALNSFLVSRDIQNTSTEQLVVPAVRKVHDWLLTYPRNMRDPENRLEGTVWTRTCFVESGMKAMLALGEAMVTHIESLESYQQKCVRFIDTERGQMEGTVGDKKRERTYTESDELIEKAMEEMDRAGQIIKLLKSMWDKVLQKDRRELGLMYNWFDVLVDLIPEIYKSYNTVLTRENVEKLQFY